MAAALPQSSLPRVRPAYCTPNPQPFLGRLPRTLSRRSPLHVCPTRLARLTSLKDVGLTSDGALRMVDFTDTFTSLHHLEYVVQPILLCSLALPRSLHRMFWRGGAINSLSSNTIGSRGARVLLETLRGTCVQLQTLKYGELKG